MLNKLLAPRALFFLVFLCSAGLMAYAFYAQYILKFEPCMLCMVQRVFMVALGLTAGIAALHNPKAKGWLVYGLTCALWATFGAYIAGRHVYLQGLPFDQLEGGCSPAFAYVLTNNDWLEVLKTFFIRKQDCGKIDWTFLGQSMPRWVLVWFVGMGLLTLWRGVTAKKALR
jgi:disulfide bond formation protein DsbB